MRSICEKQLEEPANTAILQAREKRGPDNKDAGDARGDLAGISLGKSARTMCVEAGISQRVLWNWLVNDAGTHAAILRAKELCVDAYAEEIIEISDDGTSDTYLDEKGKEVVDREVIARAQLRIDARKWYASDWRQKNTAINCRLTHEVADAKKTQLYTGSR